jgi:DNA-binding Lrp family transcriptional regulator
MNIKPQDILVVLKWLASGWPGSYAEMGKQVGLSASETHAAVQRARRAGLLQADTKGPNRSALSEFLIHGLPYVLAVRPGGRTRGMATGFSAKPLSAHFNVSPDDPDLPVWPDAEGESYGVEIRPISRSAPFAARQDARLYEWLVLVDALRGAGRAREREMARDIVRDRLENDANG